ncbi:MAG TPA: hypothetical protein VF175_10360, partial [Lacipirellula sp.]
MQAPASWRPLAQVAILATAATAAGFAICPPRAHAQFRDSVPSQNYYIGVEQLYRGELRDAQRTFNRCFTGAVKSVGPEGTIRWVDSICYHAMLGEVFYHWGQP